MGSKRKGKRQQPKSLLPDPESWREARRLQFERRPKTVVEIAALAQSLRSSINNPNESAQASLQAPSVLARCWDGMEEIGGIVPERPGVAEMASVAQVMGAMLDEGTGYDRKIKSAINEALRWCARQQAKANATATATNGAANTKPKRRGRRKADYETQQAELAIYDQWQQAKTAHVRKKDFVKQHGMKVDDLDALLDRIYQRNRTPKKPFRKPRQLFGKKK